MQNENNPQHWKEKLGDTERLSSELQLNKSVAWEKLELRLQRNKKRRKAVWYWVAAACLFPVSIVMFFLAQHPTNNLVVKASPQNRVTKNAAQPAKTVQKDSVSYKVLASSVKRKTKIKKERNDSVIMAKVNINPVEIFVDSAASKKTDLMAVKIDSAAKTPLVVEVKKKLKVVHINELNEPEESSPYLAQSHYIHTFPLQIANEEIYGNPSQLIHKTSFINFKTKLSSN